MTKYVLVVGEAYSTQLLEKEELGAATEEAESILKENFGLSKEFLSNHPGGARLFELVKTW